MRSFCVERRTHCQSLVREKERDWRPGRISKEKYWRREGGDQSLVLGVRRGRQHIPHTKSPANGRHEYEGMRESYVCEVLAFLRGIVCLSALALHLELGKPVITFRAFYREEVPFEAEGL